jgi:hypothetical protein
VIHGKCYLNGVDVSDSPFYNGKVMQLIEHHVNTNYMSGSSIRNLAADAFGAGYENVSDDNYNYIRRNNGGMRIAECIVFTNTLSYAERVKIGTYLMNKWLGKKMGYHYIDSSTQYKNIEIDSQNRIDFEVVDGTNILKTVRRFRVLICSVVAVIVVLTSSYLVTKGLVYDGTECPQTVRYGDEFSYRAEAIFESVRYEYSSDKDFLEMLESVPKLPGSYYVRAVSTSVFGNVRYGEVHKFTIVPREIDVLIVEDKILYGKNPTVEGDVAAGDTIKCRDFVYADLSKKETDVTAVLSSISVTDANGDDVTWAYSFNPVSEKIAFDPRNITVTVSSAESIYNGFPFSFD